MSQKDEALIEYLSLPEVFADLFNTTLFNGQKILSKENLQDENSAQIITGIPANAGRETVKRYRDIIKKASSGIHYIIYAVENQMNIHYDLSDREKYG